MERDLLRRQLADYAAKDRLPLHMPGHKRNIALALPREEACARTVSVKVRYTDMEEAERSQSLDEPSRLPEDFYGPIEGLLGKAWDRRVRLRMVRLRFSAIYHRWPVRNLLYTLEGKDRRERLQAVVADVQGRYGPRALMRGHRWRQDRKEGNEAERG